MREKQYLTMQNVLAEEPLAQNMEDGRHVMMLLEGICIFSQVTILRDSFFIVIQVQQTVLEPGFDFMTLFFLIILLDRITLTLSLDEKIENYRGFKILGTSIEFPLFLNFFVWIISSFLKFFI